MRISYLKIENFRGVKYSEFYLLRHIVLLGANNSGKSTIVDALSCLIGRERLVRNLGDYDFFGGTPKPEDRIKIIGVISGFPTNDPSEYPDWFNTMSGGTPCWINYKENEISDTPAEDCELGIRIGFCARFDKDDLEYEYVRYFVDADTDPFEDTVVKLQSSHLKAIGYFLLPSKRNWERTISFGSDLFKKVLKFQNAIPGQTVCDLRDSLRSTDQHIEEQEPLKDIVNRINNELSGFIQNQKQKLNFIPTNGDIDAVLQSLTPYLVGNGETNLPIGNHGSGIISLQTLLLLLEFGRFRNKEGLNFFISAEEPELHLQPGLHRRLVGRIRGLSNQSLITTHSPQIASYYKPNEINVLRNENGELSVTPLLKPFEPIPEKNALMRLYTIYRAEICEALMNRCVILPEGITEYNWFKSLLSAVITAEGWELYEGDVEPTSNLGILPTQSSNVESTYKVFSHLIDKLIPIVDGDEAGNEYVKQLKGLEIPPKSILQLPKGWCLESLIAWMVSSKNEIPVSIKNNLVSDSDSEISLSAALSTNSFKQKWGSHGYVIDYIASEPQSTKRSRGLIDSLYQVAYETSPNEMWLKDGERSNDNTIVFICNLKYD